MAFTRLEPTGVNTSATFTFANANVTTNLNVGGESNLGPVGNVTITGGSSGQVLSTDGSGTLSWVAQTGGGSDYSNANVASYLPTYTGNISANYFIGNGSSLTHITGGNVDGQVGSALIAGTVTTNAQPNITSVGTLTGLTTTDDIVSGGTLVSNYSSGNEGGEIRLALSQTGTTLNSSVTIDMHQNRLRIFESGGTNRGGYFDITALAAGVGTDLLAGGSGGYANSNVAAYLPTYTGNFTAGNISVTSNVTSAYFIGNGSSLSALNASNISTGTIPSGVLGNSTVYVGTTSIALNRSSGSQSLTGVNIDGTASTVTTAEQPNITSTGSLSGLTVSNATGVVNFTTTANVTLGSVSNLHITGGTSGQYLQTDGSGTLSWATVSGGSSSNIANGTSNVNISSSGGNVTTSVGGNANIVVVTDTGSNVNGYLTVTGALSTGGGSGGSLLGANVISANYFIGNGSALSDISGANVTGTVANATTATTAETVTTAAQPNITSVGTLVDANIAGNLFIGGNLVVSGATEYNNVTNLYVKDPIIEMGGNANAGALTTNDNKDRGTLLHYYTTAPVDAFMGWDNSAGEFAFGSNVTMSSEVATFNTYGNVRASYFLGNGSQLTGVVANANYSAYTGNVVNPSQGNITTVGTLSSLTVTGLVTATAGGIKVGNLQDTSGTNTVQLLNSNMLVTGNITAGSGGTGNVTASYFIGNGSSLTSVAATTAGTVTANAQPNITSVGALNGLTVTATANFIGSSNISFGPISNLHIDGGISGQYLQTDGSGVLTWASVSSGGSSNIANGTSNVNISSSGGNVTTSVGGTANVLVVDAGGANITGNLSVSGAVSTGGGAGGSIIGANVISANYFIGNGSQLTGLPASYSNADVAAYLPTFTGNFTAGNANISGLLSVNGAFTAGSGSGGSISGANSITANYFVGSGSFLTGVTSATTAVTVTANAQPNITSVGSLTSLTVTGLTTATGGVRTGNIQDTTGTNTISVSSTTSGVIGNLQVGTGGTGWVSASNFSGSGNTLTNLNASNISSGTIPTGVLGNSSLYVGTTQIALNRSSSSQSLTGVNIDGTAGTVTTGAQPNITSVGSLVGLVVTGTTTIQQSQESIPATKTGATGVVAHDYTTGSTFYHTSIAGNFTCNVTNYVTTQGRVSIIALILVQGATPYICNAFQIGGVAQTIKWAGGSAPTGNANKLDIIAFTILNIGGTYTVSGQLSSYG